MHIGFILLLGVFSGHVIAQTLNIVTEELPLFQHYDSHGKLSGIAVEKVESVLNHAGIDYVINVNRWSISYIAAMRNSDTCIFSIGRSQTRDNLVNWVFPITTITTSFYGLKSSNIKITSLRDAKKYKTGVIRNNYSHQYLKAHGFLEDEHLMMLSSFERVFELLKTRRSHLDLVILSDVHFDHRSLDDPFTQELERIYTLDKNGAELYFACNKQLRRDIIHKIRSAYYEVVDD